MPTPEKLNQNTIRTVGLLGSLTFLSRILGLVREMVVAAFLGTSVYSDAFTLAFSLPDLFRRLFSEGVLVNAFIPTFIAVKDKRGPQPAFEFASNLLTTLTVCLGVVCILFIVLAPILVKYTIAPGFSGSSLDLTILLTRILIGYMVLITITSVYQGMLNSFSIFWVSSLTPTLLNVCVIGGAFALTPIFANPALGFAIGIVIGGMVQLLFHLPFTAALGFKLKIGFDWKDTKTREVLWLMIPSLFGIGVYQINIFIANIIATTLETGSLSSLKFSNRLLELIIGVVVVSFSTVILPKFTVFFMANKQGELHTLLGTTIGILTFITVPITLGGLLLSEQLITILLARGEFDNQSITLTATAFRYHIIGLCFIAWNRVVLTCYQAVGKIKKIVYVGIAVIVINAVVGLLLKVIMGHSGLALAGSISQALHTIVLVFFLRELSQTNTIRIFINQTTLFCLIAGGLMWLSVFLLKQQLRQTLLPQTLQVFICFVAGVVVYLIFSILLKNKSLKDLYCQILNR